MPHLCPPLLPEIINILNSYFVQIFKIFLDCASRVLVMSHNS